MTRSAVEFQPASLFPKLQPPPPPPPPPSGVAGGTAESVGANRLPPPPPPPPPRPILPDDDRILEVLNRGPLLPFDYCYLQGQREGLVPVVQTQLVQRNPRLVSVDRTPLGIDPNADLFRCFLMRGNPNEAVTVFTAYERDICAGVVSGYFHMPEIRNHVYRHFVQLAWLQGNGLTPPAIEWLQAYDSALDRLFALIDAADTRGRARLAGRFAHWLFPLLRRLDRHDGISSYADETAIIGCHEVEHLPPGRRFFWDLLGDFTLLSIVPQPAFCAFAWIKQVQFPNIARPDIEAGQVRVVGLFSPRYLVIGLVAAIIGLMILGYGLGPVATTRSASQWILPLLLGGLPALAGLAILATNLVFWLLYTSGSETLRNLVPQRWRRGKPKNIGYLQ